MSLILCIADDVKREIASYLQPGQPLVLIWNLENEHSHVSSHVRALFEQHDRGTPQYHKMLWRKMFDTPAYSELFETQQETKHPWSLGMTEDSVSEMTLGMISADNPARTKGVLQILPDRAISERRRACAIRGEVEGHYQGPKEDLD
jgi:hypothetical protein